MEIHPIKLHSISSCCSQTCLHVPVNLHCFCVKSQLCSGTKVSASVKRYRKYCPSCSAERTTSLLFIPHVYKTFTKSWNGPPIYPNRVDQSVIQYLDPGFPFPARTKTHAQAMKTSRSGKSCLHIQICTCMHKRKKRVVQLRKGVHDDSVLAQPNVPLSFFWHLLIVPTHTPKASSRCGLAPFERLCYVTCSDGVGACRWMWRRTRALRPSWLPER